MRPATVLCHVHHTFTYQMVTLKSKIQSPVYIMTLKENYKVSRTTFRMLSYSELWIVADKNSQEKVASSHGIHRREEVFVWFMRLGREMKH